MWTWRYAAGRQSLLILLAFNFTVNAQYALTEDTVNSHLSHQHLMEEPTNCVWPNCMPKCESCTGRKLDSCWLSYIGLNSCEARHSNSTCFLGRCICEMGFCAKEVEPGKWECHPPICEFGGLEPPPVELSFWQQVFLAFTGMKSFPVPEDLMADVPAYITSIIILPTVLLVFGFISACVTIYCLCCKVFPNDDDEDDNVREHFLGLGKSRRHIEVPQPNPWYLVAMMVLVVTVTIGVIIRRTVVVKQLVVLLNSLLEHIYQDSLIVASQAKHLNATCQNFMGSVQTLVKDCSDSVVGGIVQNFEAKIDEDLQNYKDLLSNYSGMVADLPPSIGVAKADVLLNEQALIWIPNGPMIFLCVICLGILGEVFLTVVIGSSSCESCVDAGLRFAAVLFVFIIILITMTVTLVSTAGTSISQFCIDPDFNTLVYGSYFSNFSNNTAAEGVLTHYTLGQVPNPLRTMSNIAKKYIVNVDGTYKTLHWAFEGVAFVCDNTQGVNVAVLAKEVVSVLAYAELLLSGRHIWPFYLDVVRKGLCFEIVNSLGLTSVWLSIMGLLLFPLCAITAHRFLVRWSEWKEFQACESD